MRRLSTCEIISRKGRGVMKSRKKLPVGIDSFEKIIRQNFYYVDKTEIIAELLQDWGEVNLFTRPRRFGKSLNMSMLQAFFEFGCDKNLFQGLKISQERELCKKYMGQFPVISISLKSVEGLKYQNAVEALRNIIGLEAMRFSFLEDSDRLTFSEKELYHGYIEVRKGTFTMTEAMITASLRNLSMLLFKHYGRQVILLIDEYDVPLDKAFQCGYYDEMVALMRSMFGNGLKTNPDLYFAVLTGCLRIAKESIFTELNNFNVLSITSVQFDEYFGFTDDEVKEMLDYFNLSDKYETVKEWYDGYQFGKEALYCPWDVISYCRNLCADPEALPEDYWSNTSSNSIVRRFIDKANKQTKDEIEKLIAGEAIVKEIRQELTYNELDKSIDHIWSVLFTTGYLTQRERIDNKKYSLVIPNREIRELFILQIREWFRDAADSDLHKVDKLCRAFPAGDVVTIEDLFNDYLWNTISIRDTAVAKEWKENFYHGVLLGLLGHMENWLVRSNEESGEGYSDILIEVPESRTGVVIEMKYAENDRLDASCAEALQQIEDRQYAAKLIDDGMKTIVKYGIACYKKHCKVVKK